MTLFWIIVIVGYVAISLLFAYYKYTAVEYEYYGNSHIPKYHLGNRNGCYGDLKLSLTIGFLLVPFWLLITIGIFAVGFVIGVLAVRAAEYIGQLF